MRIFQVHSARSRAASSSKVLLLGDVKWSHSGDRVACGANLDDEEMSPAILVFSARGSATRVVALKDSLAIADIVTPPAWSRDDDHVVAGFGTLGTSMLSELWLADLRADSARLIWQATSRGLVSDVRFESDSDAVCFLFAEGLAGLSDAISLYRCDRAGKTEEVARLDSQPGWTLGSGRLFPDGQGLVAVTTRSVAAPRRFSESALVWTHRGQAGRLPLPQGYTGRVMGWSADGRCLAVYIGGEADDRLAVYEFK